MPKGIPKDKTFTRKITHLLKISNGHLNRVIDMVEKDEYCIDIIHQSLAVQAALKKINQKILKNHLEHCVAHSMKNGKANEVVEEVMRVIEKT